MPHLWMKPRVEGSREHIQNQSWGCPLTGQHGVKLLSVTLAPARGIQPQHPVHAWASLRCPVRATVIMDSRRARKARSPTAVSRYGLRPRASSRASAPYNVPGPSRTLAMASMSSVMAYPCRGPSARLTRISRAGSENRPKSSSSASSLSLALPLAFRTIGFTSSIAPRNTRCVLRLPI